MIKRRILAASLLAGVLALVPASADAKGARTVTVTGPGLRTPIQLTNTAAASGQAQRSAPPGPNDLANAAGLFAAFGSSPVSLEPDPPPGRLGAHYVATYDWLVGPNTTKPIRQDLYPFAAGGPLTYMAPHQQAVAGEPLRSGWHRADQHLTDLLILIGLPATRLAQTQPQAPAPVATEPQQAG